MKQLTKTQACLAVASLMLSAVAMESLLALRFSDRVSLSATSFAFVLLLMVVFDRSPMRGWPRTTLANKLIFAGVMALTPLILRLAGV